MQYLGSTMEGWYGTCKSLLMTLSGDNSFHLWRAEFSMFRYLQLWYGIHARKDYSETWFILFLTFPLCTWISAEQENKERNENNEWGKLWDDSLLHYISFVPVDANEDNWLWCKKRQCTNQMLYTENIVNISKH